jgi:hypothetical protein
VVEFETGLSATDGNYGSPFNRFGRRDWWRARSIDGVLARVGYRPGLAMRRTSRRLHMSRSRCPSIAHPRLQRPHRREFMCAHHRHLHRVAVSPRSRWRLHRHPLEADLGVTILSFSPIRRSRHRPLEVASPSIIPTH